MTKEFLRKVFSFFSILIAILISLAGLIIFFTGQNGTEKGIGIGLTVGILIGGFIKIKFKIPKMFKDKDERTIVITLLTKVISESFFAVFAYLCFVLTATGVLYFNPDKNMKMLIFIAVMIVTTQLVDKITYKILCNKL